MQPHRIEPLILFVGDVTIFALSLITMLSIRYRGSFSEYALDLHLVAFLPLFFIWTLLFFIAGLYQKHTLLFKARLPQTIIRVQLLNIIVAIVFFFSVPQVGITPKTNLLIYLLVSTVFIVWWRLKGIAFFIKRNPMRAILIAEGKEAHELLHEVNNNAHYDFQFVCHLEPTGHDALRETIIETVKKEKIKIVVIDSNNPRFVPLLPDLYELVFRGVRFVDMTQLYQDIFDRIPVSFVRENWLIENIRSGSGRVYDFFKRLFDLSVSFVLGVISLFVYPLVIGAIKYEDNGPVFFIQERVGRNGKTIRITKFRTMSMNGKESVTRVGAFLRRTRIDELPQLWNVLRGDLSLIGPRPEIPRLVSVYEREIPYYHIRHLIKPGLSGWAQIHQERPPKFGVQSSETELKLSYDLFYVKNRSLVVDFKIALFTIRTLLSRSGL